MSKKTLLNESTVRKFMKFANIEGLAQNFINETYIYMAWAQYPSGGDCLYPAPAR